MREKYTAWPASAKPGLDEIAAVLRQRFRGRSTQKGPASLGEERRGRLPRHGLFFFCFFRETGNRGVGFFLVLAPITRVVVYPVSNPPRPTHYLVALPGH